MRDLTSFASMKLKAALFVVIGLFSGALLVFGPDFSAWQRALLLAMCVWAFCRAYYFAFYVIEKYVNSSYRFSGLVSAMSYLARSKLSGEVANTSFTDPPSPRSPGLPKGWWLLWTFTIGLACIVPILHLRENTRDLIEPLRHPWGLLPSSWLGVWTFEKISWYVLAAVLIAGVVAWSKPSWVGPPSYRHCRCMCSSLRFTCSTFHVCSSVPSGRRFRLPLMSGRGYRRFANSARASYHELQVRSPNRQTLFKKLE
jgi:hypothetical protein